MHIDCTNAKANGKGAYVYVCSAPGGETIYSARQHKGHKGVKGTPAEDCQGIFVHDHDKTFYKYGTDHQECPAHMLCYLRDSTDNMPSHLLFLHDCRVPPANNEAERHLINRYCDYQKSVVKYEGR